MRRKPHKKTLSPNFCVAIRQTKAESADLDGCKIVPRNGRLGLVCVCARARSVDRYQFIGHQMGSRMVKRKNRRNWQWRNGFSYRCSCCSRCFSLSLFLHSSLSFYLYSTPPFAEQTTEMPCTWLCICSRARILGWLVWNESINQSIDCLFFSASLFRPFASISLGDFTRPNYNNLMADGGGRRLLPKSCLPSNQHTAKTKPSTLPSAIIRTPWMMLSRIFFGIVAPCPIWWHWDQ